MYPSESDEKIIHVLYYHIIDHNFRLTCTTTFIQNTFDSPIKIHGVTVLERFEQGLLGTDTTSQIGHIENHDAKAPHTRTAITQAIFVI
jgi:hypothetical protein